MVCRFWVYETSVSMLPVSVRTKINEAAVNMDTNSLEVEIRLLVYFQSGGDTQTK